VLRIFVACVNVCLWHNIPVSICVYSLEMVANCDVFGHWREVPTFGPAH
jgi:hypothetical protein